LKLNFPALSALVVRADVHAVGQVDEEDFVACGGLLVCVVPVVEAGA